MSIVIPSRPAGPGRRHAFERTFPGLNDYVKVERGNRYAANRMKQRYTDLVREIAAISHEPRHEEPVIVHFHWYEEDTLRDLDNIAFAKKFVLDGLVKAGVIPDDGWDYVKGFTDAFDVDRRNPRLEVAVEPADRV